MYYVSQTISGCEGPRSPISVTVNPEPVVANQTVTTCSRVAVGDNFNSSSLTSVAAATYNVTALNLNGLTVSAGNPQVATGLLVTDLADDSFKNTTTAAVNVVYTVVPVSAAGCKGASFTVTVTVNPEPVVANQIATTCSRVAVGVNFNSSSLTSVAAATYNVTVLNLNGLTVLAGNPQVAAGLLATDLANDALPELIP